MYFLFHLFLVFIQGSPIETTYLYLTRQVIQEQILCYNASLPRPHPNPDDAGPIVSSPMGFPITACCEPGIEPGSVLMPPALRCSALDRCATRETQGAIMMPGVKQMFY